MARDVDRFFPGHFMGDEEVIEAQKKLKKHLRRNMRQISQSLDNLNHIGSFSYYGHSHNKNGQYPSLINPVIPLGHVQSCVQKVLNCRANNFCNSTESLPRFHSLFYDLEPKIVKKTALKGFDEMIFEEKMHRKRRNGLGINVVTRKPIHVSNIKYM